MTTTSETQIRTELWVDPKDFECEHEGTVVRVEVERTGSNEIAFHTYIDGAGSMVSFYFDRESAIRMAAAFLSAAAL